jgi:hypothetical protein
MLFSLFLSKTYRNKIKRIVLEPVTHFLESVTHFLVFLLPDKVGVLQVRLLSRTQIVCHWQLFLALIFETYPGNTLSKKPHPN